jgi:hypothetical protein
VVVSAAGRKSTTKCNEHVDGKQNKDAEVRDTICMQNARIVNYIVKSQLRTFHLPYTVGRYNTCHCTV